jgi:hypothetical protein
VILAAQPSMGLTDTEINGVPVGTLKAKTPSDEGVCVPKVGLELHPSPWEHWEPAESCGIRSNPKDVRPGPNEEALTLSTPPHFATPKASEGSRMTGLDVPMS